jgi:hypothetical protein
MVSAQELSILGGLGLVQGVLTIIAAYYGYRITRVVGVFWAWAFIVAASALSAFRAISSVGPISFVPTKLDGPTLGEVGTSAIVFSEVINISEAVLFAAGMYGLYRIFHGQKKEEPPRQLVTPLIQATPERTLD